MQLKGKEYICHQLLARYALNDWCCPNSLCPSLRSHRLYNSVKFLLIDERLQVTQLYPNNVQRKTNSKPIRLPIVPNSRIQATLSQIYSTSAFWMTPRKKLPDPDIFTPLLQYVPVQSRNRALLFETANRPSYINSTKLTGNISPRRVSLTCHLPTTCENTPVSRPLWFLLTCKTNRDALVKTYFDHVHPFSAVVSRAEFIRGYQSGDCSLLLLRVMLTAASIHAPVDVLFALGFASRSIAQESFFVKARRLYDFGGDPLVMLQASILMCTVILDHPTDRDFGYWFHNAVSIANRLNLRAMYVYYFQSARLWRVLHLLTMESMTSMSEGHTYGSLKLYRRIWWTLCVSTFSIHGALSILHEAHSSL